MPDPDYNPAERRERYLRERELKGRRPGIGRPKELDLIKSKTGRSKSSAKGRGSSKAQRAEAQDKLVRLTGKVEKLNRALRETKKTLAEKRKDSEKTRRNQKKREKQNSDGKTTAKERAASKKYRDSHRGKIAASNKKAAKSSKKPADMSVDQLEDRVADIEVALSSAKAQVKAAAREVKSLKHSALLDDIPTASSFGVGLQHTNQGKETVKMTVTLDKKPNFGGWATKAGLECADGLTIGHDAFKDMDGLKVPLVYQHGHDEIGNVLGHALLENRGEGVYAHCFFNDSPNAQIAQSAVENGDLTMMSIYANRLRKQGDTVLHGVIREVSLVLAGANPGALIDFVEMRHSDGSWDVVETEAVITTGLEIKHSAAVDAVIDEKTDDLDPDDVWKSMSPAQQELMREALAMVAEAHSGDDENDDEGDDAPDGSDDAGDAGTDADTPEEGADADAGDGTDAGETDNGADAPDAADAGTPAQHDALNNSDDLEGSDMTTTTGEKLTHNVFDQAAIAHMNKEAGENGPKLTGMAKDNKYVLSHSDKEKIFADALQQRSSSLKDVVEGHKIQHGIENIDILFPDAKAVSNAPEWVSRRTEWVSRVLDGAKHTPFSRIKSLTADITLEKARAKGYIKGALKREEFFAVAKRVTTPQTIYKKQKLDRDDILDITDFDVVVWLKGEMRLMLDEELARAVLIGDGRSNADDDKILEDKIRPIATDHELYVTTQYVSLSGSTSIEALVDEVLLSRRHYRGSGNPVFFTTEIYLSLMLNVKDTTGRRIYQNVSDLASVLRVSSIIPVEVMEDEENLIGIMVNMADYTIGTDRGGNIALFDDFDIDYNQYKYLIETRCSGALTKAKSALVFRKAGDNDELAVAQAPSWDPATHRVTVQDTEGIEYKSQNNGAVLSPAGPVTLNPDQSLTVVAVPKSGYYLSSSAADEFTFTYEDGLVEGPH